ncbi:MAG: redox-regulated ATPase YchF [Anaerolineaceae bacterium]|nr:redox-regulated ATPase YchF [Anaerolineaceae bacterium]
MSLSIGIIGLPNVGKSTTFNALVKEQNAQVANYPFCTIEPNKAIVPIPDLRLEELAKMVAVEKKIHATVEFVDVAGLVKGASQGEGLGNQFLGNIRDVDAILHVVRCFEDTNVVHVSAHPDPLEDIEIIHTELALADLQQLERKVEKLERQVKGDRKLQPVLDMAFELREFLGSGQPLWHYAARSSSTFKILNAEMRFLTAKPMIIAANVDEKNLVEESDIVQTIRSSAQNDGIEFIKICAHLEEEISQFSEEERQEYLTLSGIQESGLEQLIHKSYQILGLISYFSFNEEEVRAWSIPAGYSAPQAAGVIHTDFEKGFIRAEVAHFEIFKQHGNWSSLKAVGQLRSEGRNYIMQDGDVVYFRFNV